MQKTVNTEKFLQYVREQGQIAKHNECAAMRSCNYEEAIKQREQKLTWEFLYNICTGSEDTDIADFMEG